MSEHGPLTLEGYLTIIDRTLSALEHPDYREHGCVCRPEQSCYVHGVLVPLARGALADLARLVVSRPEGSAVEGGEDG